MAKNSMSREKSGLIIAADDDLTMTVMIEALAKAVGIDAKTYCDGKYVLDALEKYEPDMLVLDVCMDNMTGFEVCQQLRETNDSNRSDLPVLIITGNDNIDSMLAAQLAGATDILAKPINWQFFKNLISYMINRNDLTMLSEMDNTEGCGILILDEADLQIIHANISLCLRLGLTNSELREKNVIDIIDDLDHSNLFSTLSNLSVDLDTRNSIEVNFICDNNRNYPAKIFFHRPVREFPGTIFGIIVPVTSQ